MESNPPSTPPLVRRGTISLDSGSRLAALSKHESILLADMSEEDKLFQQRNCVGRSKMWWRSYSVEFRELVVYIFFLLIYLIVIFGPSGIILDRFQLNSQMTTNIHGNFYSITNVTDWYSFILEDLLPNLNSIEWYSGSSPNSDRQFAIDGVNRRVGAIRIRLIRVRDQLRDLPAVYINEFQHLYPNLNYDVNIETSPMILSSGLQVAWSSGPALGNKVNTFCPVTGIYYPPSGYVLDIPNGLENATDFVSMLQSEGLIDSATRAILVDYSVYNANTDEFGVATLVTQFLSTGGVYPESVVVAAPLLSTYRVLTGDSFSSTWQMITYLEICLYLTVFILLQKEIFLVRALGFKGYFSDNFVFLDLLNYFCFLVVMSMRLNLMVNLWFLSDELVGDNGQAYINLVNSASNYFWTEAISSFNCIITFLKIFKYLRPIKRIALFSETLRLSAPDMAYMSIIIGVILLAFALSFNLAFGAHVYNYINLSKSFLSLFRASLGDFDLDALVSSNYILGPFLFVLFIFLFFFVVMSMFLSIVSESYDTVSGQLEERANAPPEPLERDLVRFRNEVSDVLWKIVEFVSGLRRSPKVSPDDIAGQSAELTSSSFRADSEEATSILPEAVANKPGGGAEFMKRRDGLLEGAGPLVDALGGAFLQLGTLAQQQAELTAKLDELSQTLVRRRTKVIKAALSDPASDLKADEVDFLRLK